ncbi:MAG: replication-relaxation family protein [Anaerolineae bacterium]|nr:replication-relaxation family protein [Anaerolineae bacterium]
MAKRISHQRITDIMLTMTKQALDDLARFEHHKKWTVRLLAMHLNIDQSTANRRLRRLVDLSLLARRPGDRQERGRSPDLYYLTPLGAVVLTRYLQRETGIEAPSIANPASNVHDLLVLELAIRLGWEKIRHREKITLTQYRWQTDRKLEPTGETFSLVPDLIIHGSDSMDTFIEVEQTAHYKHIRRKYETYMQVAYTYLAEDRGLPYLYFIFGDEQQERSLLPLHMQALREVYRPLMVVGYTHMEAVRSRDVRSLTDLDEIVHIEGGDF